MEVKILDDQGCEVWSRWRRGNQRGGVACLAYRSDGRQEAIVAALADALEQGRLEMSGLENLDAVADLGIGVTNIDGDVPVSG